MTIRQHSTRYLRRKRQKLLRRMPPLDAILRGSLIIRFKPCGKPGCRCAQGPGHGPKHYLSVTFPGSNPEISYVPQQEQELVTEYLANFRLVREILEEICNINRELLRRRERM